MSNEKKPLPIPSSHKALPPLPPRRVPQTLSSHYTVTQASIQRGILNSITQPSVLPPSDTASTTSEKKPRALPTSPLQQRMLSSLPSNVPQTISSDYTVAQATPQNNLPNSMIEPISPSSKLSKFSPVNFSIPETTSSDYTVTTQDFSPPIQRCHWFFYR